ncbi:MAG: LysM domain-containing protein [Bacteroidia bacterium]|nr:LysM domain-containing protein [Bacteroidia bacterium]
MKQNFLYLIVAIAFMGCSSPKKAQESHRESTYTTDYTVPVGNIVQPATVVPTVAGPRVHTVQKGESLSVIAKQYGVTVKAIAEANNIANPNMIKINQKLIIPEKKENLD